MCGRPFWCKRKSVMPLRGRVQRCVRPVDAAPMAAGPDEVRGSDPKSPQRARSAWTPRVSPIPSSTGSSSRLTTFALPLDQRNAASRAERRALIECENPTLPITQQCRLLAVSRSSVYRRPAAVSEAYFAKLPPICGGSAPNASRCRFSGMRAILFASAAAGNKALHRSCWLQTSCAPTPRRSGVCG